MKENKAKHKRQEAVEDCNCPLSEMDGRLQLPAARDHNL